MIRFHLDVICVSFPSAVSLKKPAPREIFPEVENWIIFVIIGQKTEIFAFSLYT